MKKIFTFALCAVLAFSLAACGGGSAPGGGESEPALAAPGENAVQRPNPFVECESLEKAAELAGFGITVPESVPGGGKPVIRVMEGEMLELVYQNKGQEVRIRKAPGSGDISGDYGQYDETATVSVDEVQVQQKGSGGKVSVAVWAAGEYSYSITASSAMTGEEAAELVRAVR